MIVFMSNDVTVVFVRGVPGSGKSYITSRFVATLIDGSYVSLDPDAIERRVAEYQDFSRQLTEQGVDKKFHDYRYLRQQAYDAISAQQTVVWNQPFIDFKSFELTVTRLSEYASEVGRSLRIIIVEVEVDDATARARVASRKSEGGHGPDEQTMDRFLSQYRSFTSEGYQIVSVRGDGDTEQAVATMRGAILS